MRDKESKTREFDALAVTADDTTILARDWGGTRVPEASAELVVSQGSGTCGGLVKTGPRVGGHRLLCLPCCQTRDVLVWVSNCYEA